MGTLRRFTRSEEAQAVIEFAIAVVILLVIVLGIFDLGRAVWFSNTLSFATREAARCAIVGGSECTGAKSPATVVQRYAIGVGTPAVTTTFCSKPPATCTGAGMPDDARGLGSYVTVTATFPFVPLASSYFMNGGMNVTLRGETTMLVRFEGLPPSGSPTPTPSPSPCTVPNFIGLGTSRAQATWNDALFTTTVTIRPPNNNYIIGAQSIPAGQTRPCGTTTITVSRN